MKNRFILLALTIAALLALAAPAAALPQVPVEKFQPSQACGCHSALLEEWSRSMHAKAMSDPIYLVKLEEANKATDGAIGPFCDGCHGPVATMGGQAKDMSNAAPQAKEGINCDFCHQVTGTVAPIGNVSQLLSPDGVKRAQFDDSRSPAHETTYSAFHETAEFCGTCHNVDHPGNGMHLEATYTEWKEGPYAAEGTTCQDCHMTPGPGETVPNAGTAAAGGPQRQHIFTMTFAGGNVALGDADLAEERLKAAATMDVQVPEIVEVGSSADVVVTITNSGAGHKLPTGLTEVRQMWLEVTAEQEDGTSVTLGTHEFGSVLKDDKGNSPVELWEATGFAKDDRIAPRESSTDTFAFEMPESGVAKLRAALYYRSCDETMAAKAGVDVPTTTMVESIVPVYASEKLRSDALRAERAGDGETRSPLLLIALGGLLLVVATAAVMVVRARRA